MIFAVVADLRFRASWRSLHNLDDLKRTGVCFTYDGVRLPRGLLLPSQRIMYPTNITSTTTSSSSISIYYGQLERLVLQLRYERGAAVRPVILCFTHQSYFRRATASFYTLIMPVLFARCPTRAYSTLFVLEMEGFHFIREVVEHWSWQSLF